MYLDFCVGAYSGSTDLRSTDLREEAGNCSCS